jgi:hypothetical protein
MQIPGVDSLPPRFVRVDLDDFLHIDSSLLEPVDDCLGILHGEGSLVALELFPFPVR